MKRRYLAMKASAIALAVLNASACGEYGQTESAAYDWAVARQALCSAPVPEKTTFTVGVPLPPGFSIGDVSILADDELEIRDVDIPGTLVNTGNGDCTVFSGAKIGNLYCRGQVDLRDGSEVTGGIFTTGEEITQGSPIYNPANVDIDFTFEPEREVRLNFPMPPNLNIQPNVWIDVDEVKTVAPGNYNRVELRNNALGVLSPGVYWVNELQMEPPSKFSIDTTACTAGGTPCSVVFNVASLVDPALRGFAAGVNPDFLLIYHGTSQVLVNTTFSGFIMAMNATLRLNNDIPHAGAFFARTIIIDAGQTITHRPFIPSVFEVWEP